MRSSSATDHVLGIQTANHGETHRTVAALAAESIGGRFER
jgi:hypothetical protein